MKKNKSKKLLAMQNNNWCMVPSPWCISDAGIFFQSKNAFSRIFTNSLFRNDFVFAPTGAKCVRAQNHKITSIQNMKVEFSNYRTQLKIQFLRTILPKNLGKKRVTIFINHM